MKQARSDPPLAGHSLASTFLDEPHEKLAVPEFCLAVMLNICADVQSFWTLRLRSLSDVCCSML